MARLCAAQRVIHGLDRPHRHAKTSKRGVRSMTPHAHPGLITLLLQRA